MSKTSEPKTRKDYISNAELTKDLGDWAAARRIAISAGQPLPPFPESVGEAALKIATRYSRRSNFCGYTFREDLISNGLLSVILYAHNFDSKKSSNGFAYITQILHSAFVRTILSENKQSYVKAKLLKDSLPEVKDYTDATITDYEAYTAKRKAKSKALYERKLENAA
jgi:hypothetical protein